MDQLEDEFISVFDGAQTLTDLGLFHNQTAFLDFSCPVHRKLAKNSDATPIRFHDPYHKDNLM